MHAAGSSSWVKTRAWTWNLAVCGGQAVVSISTSLAGQGARTWGHEGAPRGISAGRSTLCVMVYEPGSIGHDSVALALSLREFEVLSVT